MKPAILIGHLDSAANEGAIIRSAEAFGINSVFVLGHKKPKYRESMGAERHVVFTEFDTPIAVVNHCVRENASIVAIENVHEARFIDEIDKYSRNPVFVVGNERNGVPDELLNAARMTVQIRQGFGYTRCLNASVAAGIVFHDFHVKTR